MAEKVKGFKDSNDQRKFTLELRKILTSKEFTDMISIYNIHIGAYGHGELTGTSVEILLQYIVKKISYDITLEPNHNIIYYYYINGIDIANRLNGIDCIIKYNNCNYRIYSNFWDTLHLNINEYLSDAEKIQKRENIETDYAVVSINGKSALVKLIDGDRRAIASKRYVKKELIDGKDEEAIKLLYKLNPNGLTKGETK